MTHAELLALSGAVTDPRRRHIDPRDYERRLIKVLGAPFVGLLWLILLPVKAMLALAMFPVATLLSLALWAGVFFACRALAQLL